MNIDDPKIPSYIQEILHILYKSDEFLVQDLMEYIEELHEKSDTVTGATVSGSRYPYGN